LTATFADMGLYGVITLVLHVHLAIISVSIVYLLSVKTDLRGLIAVLLQPRIRKEKGGKREMRDNPQIPYLIH